MAYRLLLPVAWSLQKRAACAIVNPSRGIGAAENDRGYDAYRPEIVYDVAQMIPRNLKFCIFTPKSFFARAVSFYEEKVLPPALQALMRTMEKLHAAAKIAAVILPRSQFLTKSQRVPICIRHIELPPAPALVNGSLVHG